ncbi:MAG: hypothetical protein GC181_04840 [Bacteroidetes bacterium]|nr:hypothetical protein [Bacteroidota bacterium]
MESKSQKLRQKAINLLYLIFLAFLFSFIPSDFVDTTYITNTSLNHLCNEVERHSSKYNMLVLSYVQKDAELFNKTKLKIIAVDELSDAQIQNIEEMKLELIKRSGFNKYDYLKNGKSENPSNSYMISEGNATNLVSSLRKYKQDLIELLSAEDAAILDSIMPLPEMMRRSDGDFVSIEHFYFKKNPLNVALLNLSHFKGRVEEARTFTVGKIIEQVASIQPRVVPEEIAKIIMQNNELKGNLEHIKSYKASTNPNGKTSKETPKEETPKKVETPETPKGPKSPAFLSVESVSDSVYAVGKPVRFHVNYENGKNTMPVSVRLRNPDGEIENVTMTSPGNFMFVPKVKGYYSIKFNSGDKSTDKFIKVMDLDPVLQNNQMGTLYVGIDNSLNVKTSEFEDTEGLTAKISEGQILKKGSNFYARVYRPGIVLVEIFAKMPYGFVKVAEKQFVVRELSTPSAVILGKSNGSVLTVEEIGNVKNVQIESQEYLVSEQFYVSHFDFTVIYNNHTSILQPISNSGNSLNTVSLDALKKVKTGDILIFSNIKAKSSLGKDIDVAPLTYTVQ